MRASRRPGAAGGHRPDARCAACARERPWRQAWRRTWQPVRPASYCGSACATWPCCCVPACGPDRGRSAYRRRICAANPVWCGWSSA
ncbi:DUF2256 domain-containing protein [Methyloversatilis sp.]|uniref:DUF2256 domain-containing protein n=1 Tax=Methyloversatilis sp. TaxID=2569862 RepID=UPI0035AFDF7C